MQKTFMQLVHKFKKLGASIVFANFHKIIITTGRDTLESAHIYTDFIINTIHEDPLLVYIRLSPNTYWRSLLFKDAHNYAGIQENEPVSDY